MASSLIPTVAFLGAEARESLHGDYSEEGQADW